MSRVTAAVAIVFALACSGAPPATTDTGPDTEPDAGKTPTADTGIAAVDDAGAAAPACIRADDPSDPRADLFAERFGYGAETEGGGASACVYHVTRFDDPPGDVPGTLRHGATRLEPLWIVFDAGLEAPRRIRLERPLAVAAGKTIDGRGARMVITGSLTRVTESEVIISDIAFDDIDALMALRVSRTYADPPAYPVVRNVWLHHLAFSRVHQGTDVIGVNLLAVTDGSRAVTVSWSRFTNQDKAVEVGNVGAGPGNFPDDRGMTLTFHHNALRGNNRRHPRFNIGTFHAYNNVAEGWGCDGYGLAAVNGSHVLAEANVFSARPASACSSGCGRARAIVFVDLDAGCMPIGGTHGSLRSVGNVLRNGAEAGSRLPGSVATPPYPYDASPAGTPLERRIEAEAGPRVCTTVPDTCPRSPG